MRLWSLILIAFSLLPASIAASEEGERRMAQEITWPSESRGWTWDEKRLTYDSRTIFDYIDGAGELYLAYNFQNLIVRRFVKTGQPAIIAELYRMGSSEDAFGVFSFERQDDDVDIGQGSEFGGGLLRFWKGKYFISVYAEGEGPEINPAILDLGQQLARIIPEEGPSPRLISYLPGTEAGLIEKNIRYLRHYVLLNQRFFIANQNILILAKNTEAVLAQYWVDRQKIHLLLIRYPTAEQAERALQSFKKFYMPEDKGKGVLQTEDQKWTMARRREKFVCLIFGASQERDAEKLIRVTEAKLPRREP
jgi:hypothetical protein